MIGLHSTLRDDGVSALLLGVCHQEFQLTGFVAAAGKTSAVIALDPDVRTIQQPGEVFHRFKRCW